MRRRLDDTVCFASSRHAHARQRVRIRRGPETARSRHVARPRIPCSPREPYAHACGAFADSGALLASGAGPLPRCPRRRPTGSDPVSWRKPRGYRPARLPSQNEPVDVSRCAIACPARRAPDRQRYAARTAADTVGYGSSGQEPLIWMSAAARRDALGTTSAQPEPRTGRAAACTGPNRSARLAMQASAAGAQAGHPRSDLPSGAFDLT